MYLKHQEFNSPPIKYSSKNYRTLNNFKGPYVNFMPEIKIYDITDKDEYIVLASDGLWELINNKQIESIINNEKCKEKIAKILINLCIERSAKDSNLPVNKILSLNPGPNKRDIIDDITIMIVDLKNQTTSNI